MIRRFISLLIFISVAFVAGMIYERLQAEDRCARAGGDWADGLCQGAEG